MDAELVTANPAARRTGRRAGRKTPDTVTADRAPAEDPARCQSTSSRPSSSASADEPPRPALPHPGRHRRCGLARLRAAVERPRSRRPRRSMWSAPWSAAGRIKGTKTGASRVVDLTPPAGRRAGPPADRRSRQRRSRPAVTSPSCVFPSEAGTPLDDMNVAPALPGDRDGAPACRSSASTTYATPSPRTSSRSAPPSPTSPPNSATRSRR